MYREHVKHLSTQFYPYGINLIMQIKSEFRCPKIRSQLNI